MVTTFYDHSPSPCLLLLLVLFISYHASSKVRKFVQLVVSGGYQKVSQRTPHRRASRFFLFERANILVGNRSFRNWKMYLRKLLKILERIKFSHFTCDLTPPYWQTPKICKFAQFDWWLHQTQGKGCYRG